MHKLAGRAGRGGQKQDPGLGLTLPSGGSRHCLVALGSLLPPLPRGGKLGRHPLCFFQIKYLRSSRYIFQELNSGFIQMQKDGPGWFSMCHVAGPVKYFAPKSSLPPPPCTVLPGSESEHDQIGGGSEPRLWLGLSITLNYEFKHARRALDIVLHFKKMSLNKGGGGSL